MIDRQLSEHTYSSLICAAIAAFSMRRRITYRSRSNSESSVPRTLRSMICSISGRVAFAFSPITDTSIGTWRQP